MLTDSELEQRYQALAEQAARVMSRHDRLPPHKRIASWEEKITVAAQAQYEAMIEKQIQARTSEKFIKRREGLTGLAHP